MKWRLFFEIKETGEKVTLCDGEKFLNFDKLADILGGENSQEYINLNDDLMNGPSSATWLDDPINPIYRVFKNGEIKATLLFHYEEI